MIALRKVLTVPLDFHSGSWVPWTGNSDTAFNETVPTTRGPRSNHFEGLPTHTFWSIETISKKLTESWYGNQPIAGAVQGCAKRKCKVTIRAPALAPACRAHSVAIDSTQPWDWKSAIAFNVAPPTYARGFSIGVTLVVSDEREWIALVVSNTDMQPTGCAGVLHTTLCSLESAVGEYSVEIVDDQIQMLDLQMPTTITALSNNTQVNHTAHGASGLHPSTLGGKHHFHLRHHMVPY